MPTHCKQCTYVDCLYLFAGFVACSGQGKIKGKHWETNDRKEERLVETGREQIEEKNKERRENKNKKEKNRRENPQQTTSLMMAKRDLNIQTALFRSPLSSSFCFSLSLVFLVLEISTCKSFCFCSLRLHFYRNAVWHYSNVQLPCGQRLILGLFSFFFGIFRRATKSYVIS